MEHRRTEIRTLRTHGFVERVSRSLLDECFPVARRTARYVSTRETRRDLDGLPEFYDLEGSHPGIA
jgi:hypothetical protein